MTRIIGEVRDRPCLIVDDMISTGGTIEKTVEALLNAGAYPEILVAATHGLFLEDAQTKLSDGSIKAVFVTDTVTQEQAWSKRQVVSIAPLIATAIQRFKFDESLEGLL